MSTLFCTGISEEKDSFKAGVSVASQALKKLDSSKPHVALLFCSVIYDYAQLIAGFKSITGEISIIGCTTSGEFTEGGVSKNGVACALISTDSYSFNMGMGLNLKENVYQTVQDAKEKFPPVDYAFPFNSAMIFVDGLAGKGEEAVLTAAEVMTEDVIFIGGAAGDNLQFKETKVIVNNDVFSDGVGICSINSKKPIIISVKHGHRPLSGPLIITKSVDNIVYEINGRPALDAWKDVVRPFSPDVDSCNESELKECLLKFQFGIMTGGEYKVRSPFPRPHGNALNFTCSMMEGTTIKVMDSTENDQIFSAKRAAELAMAQVKNQKIAGAIIFDCACRAMILKNRFPEAIQEIRNVLKDIPLIGFESYGEIAMKAGHFSGFHNTTTAIMLIPD